MSDDPTRLVAVTLRFEQWQAITTMIDDELRESEYYGEHPDGYDEIIEEIQSQAVRL